MTTNQTERRFCLAGLEVRLTSSEGMPSLGGFYQAYPSRHDPADLVIDFTVDPSLGETGAPTPDYPAFRRSVDGSAIVLERLDVEGALEMPADSSRPIAGRFRVAASPHSIEAAIRAGLSIALPRKGGLILHASAVVHNGAALAFSGKSGAGKSALATLLTHGVPGVVQLADDLLVVTPGDPGWLAHVVPFIGSAGLPHGSTYPLSAIHFLVQATANQRVELTPKDGLRELLRHVLAHVAEARTADSVLAAAAHLVAEVPLYTLEFRKEIDVVHVLGIT